jgi:hypothetical protein
LIQIFTLCDSDSIFRGGHHMMKWSRAKAQRTRILLSSYMMSEAAQSTRRLSVSTEMSSALIMK